MPSRLVRVQDTANMPVDHSKATDKAREYVQSQIHYDQGTLNDVIMLHHGNNAEVAIALSGTSDKKSKEYKAAIRSIQMYRKGDSKPGRKYQAKLVDELRSNESYLASRAGDQTRGATVTVSGTVQISKIAERRNMKATMSANQLSRFLSEALHNNEAGYSVFANAGNYPEFSAVYNDVQITITT